MKSNIFPGWGLLFLSALILFGIKPAYTANLSNVTVSVSNAQASATGVTYTFSMNADAAILKTDNIRIVFPTGTGLGSVTAASITVNGVTTFGGGGTAFNVTTNTLTIDHQANSGNDLPAGSWTIVVSNVTNSATVSSIHTVNIDAPTPGTVATSSAFTITSATGVSFVGGATTPTLGSLSASAVTSYSISPTLIGHAAGDQIVVTFPLGTVLPSSIATTEVTVNSASPSAVSVNVSTLKVTLTIGTLFAGGVIPVSFTSTAGIANPSSVATTGSGISVSTNLQPSAGTTNSYTITGASNLTAANVTLNPTTVNTVSQYTAAFNVGSSGALTASTDSVIITFPSGTLVPSSISTSSVTINSVAPASVNTNVSLRSIRMKIGAITVLNGGGVSVIFASSAGIQSPASSGSYTLSARTNKESAVTSNSYSVTASTLSTPTVTLGTPNPSVASTYTFGFSVGAGGAMTANSSIFTVTFPTGTTLNPATLSASTISVNGTAVTVSPTVNAGSRTVQFTTPVDISDNGAVSLVFSTGITNPAAVGSYTASIQSSIETTNITTQSYSIQNTTAVTGFSVAPSGSGISYTIIKSTTLTYTFTFTTSAAGALIKGQFISFYFPSGFNLAGAAVSASTGFITSQAGAVLNKTGTTVTMTVAGGPSGQLGNSTTGTITFTGITNSSTAKTDNVIGITTSSDGTLVNTAAFVLFDDTQITGVSVTPTPTTVNTTAAYSFSFTNANETTLKGARDSVYVTFPPSTTIPATIANDAVKVNGISAYSVSKSGQTVYVVIPGDIAASASVTVNFSVDAGIVSNTTLTSQNATVKVSATQTPQNAAFTLTALTTISTPTVTPSTLIKSSTDVQYTVSFSTNNALSTSDSIVVVFPTGMLPNNSTAQTRYTSVKVNGSYLTLGTQLKVYGDNTTLALKTPVAVSGNTTTTLILETGFGITNPTSANSYTLDARTTQDVTPVTSNSFTITNSTVTGVTVSVSPSTISTTGDYTLAFTTGAGGALSGGSGKVYLIFPYGTTLPASIAPGNVTINSVAASAVQVSKVNATNQDTVIVTTTNSLGNGASVSVNLTTSATITNPATASSSYQAKVYTDSEPTAVPSASYTISAANAVTNVLLKYQSSQVASATNVVDSVQFVQPGASVVAGNLIYVTFPSGYTLSATPTVRVQNTAVVTRTLSGNTYTITVPAGVTVTAGNTISVVFSGTGGIQNPATAGSSYTLSVYTSVGAAQQVSSSNFTIVSGAAPTAGNVTVSPNTANTTAAYSVAFTTSANGKLITGDKIFLTFPSGTTIPSSISASSVSVNGTVCSVAPSVSGQLVTVTVPSQINISTAVSVNFNLSAGLVNPPAATYTIGTGLSLYTTINNVSVTENSYTIVANTNLTPATVTLSPSTVNTISQYTLSFTNGNSSVLVSDYFEIIFPAGTVIPSVISTSTVSINGVAPTTVTTTPASNLVKVYPGSTVNSDQAVSLVFNQAAGIQNPSTSGGKTLTVSKNSGTAITSSSYTVTTSTGTAATVSLSPSTNNVSGGYTINYSAGVGGALTANSGTITVTFPSGTTVPASISANQITVNSTPVSVNPTINTTNRTVTFVAPVNISNSGSVVIVFSTGAAITNPASVASNYTLSVASSAEPSAVTSQVYAITSATDVGVATVTTVSNLISTATNYTVSFLTNSTFSPGSTTVTLAFPTGTTIGTLTGNVQIGANDANYQTVGTISTSGLQVTLTIPAASGFTAGTDVCWVKFNANSITNPSTAGSNKTISVKQGSGNFVTSNRYTIITTDAVTSFTVSPSPNTGNSPAAYSIAFTTGSNGALFAGDAIAITFPDWTTLPGSIAASAISVNSIAATVAPNISGQILTIYIPDNISVSSSVSITIALSAGITNPTAGIDKQATLTTTSQTGVASSANYTIINSTNITSSTVTLSNTTVKTTSQYQLDFTNGTAAINAGGTLAVTFAGGYTLPGSITTGNVTVQSGSPLVTRTISTVGVAGQVITLTLGASQTIAASTPVRITFAVGAAVVNPTTASATYTLSIAATGNGSSTSSNYSITASTITTPALTLGNSAISATTTNSIAFTTGAAGALTSGVSTLTVTFPAGTTVPGSITASNISVNGVDATTVSSNATTRVVTITSPVSVTDHGSVTVLFKAGAAIVNPSTAGSYTLSVYTSAETTPVSSSTYTITTGTTITSPTVSRSSIVSAATSNYTISFNLGSAGTIGNGNFIYVSFPTGTVVSGVNTGNSLINGVAPSAVTITGQEVRLTNNSGTIANSASVTLSFTGLTNPTTAVSNYTLSAKSNVENNYVASSVYKVIATSNTMTPAIVTNSDNFINANATYAITYTNGSNGKLLTGDKIYLTFAAGYSLTQIASGSVQVNNVATTTATTVSGQTFTVTTPVDINAGASVTINLLDATKISNPPTGGNKNISVSSDIETSNKTSTSYPIYFLDGSLPVELTSFTVKQNKGAVLIEWTTESELDNAMFKVFRTDSETGEANEITRITGMGTKSSRTDYKYVDKLVTAGKKYSYQLIDYSYDGTESIHDAVTIEIETPKVFNLEQNYPNPFNPETTVPFAVPFKANVSLEVYNILGQRVKVLVNDVYEPGVYSLVWNGRNDNGEMASTGVYFIRMQAATFNKVLKMTLLK